MEEEVRLSYEERMEERKKIIVEIDGIKIKIENLSKNMKNIEIKIKEFNDKMRKLKKEIKKCKEKKVNLFNEIKNLEKEYIEKGIPVPSLGKYEILNGLLGAKRDINIKLIRDLTDDDVKQVSTLSYFIYLFIYIFIYLFIYLFEVIWNFVRVFFMEKSFLV
jgi:DNA repair exonuclease SbcCD ATPase subunit